MEFQHKRIIETAIDELQARYPTLARSLQRYAVRSRAWWRA